MAKQKEKGRRRESARRRTALAVLSWIWFSPLQQGALYVVLTSAGIDPSKFLDHLLFGDKKPGSMMTCGRKLVACMGVMSICGTWIRYGRQARNDSLGNNGCKPKQAARPIEGSERRARTSYDSAPNTPAIWMEFDKSHQPTREAEDDTWKLSLSSSRPGQCKSNCVKARVELTSPWLGTIVPIDIGPP
jgi:hypothetical protein